MIKNKILFSLIMIVAVFTLLFPNVHAADNNTITINGDIGGKHIKIYRLLNFDNQNSNYTFTSAESDSAEDKDRMTKSQAFFFSNGFNYPEKQTEGPAITRHTNFEKVYEITEWLKKHTNDQDALMAMAEAYYTYANANGLSPVAVVDLSTDLTATTYTVGSLKQGYYMIYDDTSDEVLATLDASKSAPMLSVVPLTGTNATVGVKSDTITTPGKTVSPTTQMVGENVTFTVTATIPNMLEYKQYTFNLLDEMSSGLDYIANSSSIKITKNSKTDVTLVQGTDYDFTVNGRKLTVEMKDFLKWRELGYNEGTITWTYQAKLNSNAILPGATINSVKTVYSNDPVTNATGTTEPHKVEVKVYNLEFTKVDSDGVALEGAGFRITNQADGSIVVFDKTTGIVATSDTAAENRTEIITSDANGKFSFKGLEAGTYNLREVSLSDALKEKYRMSNFDMIIKITEEDGVVSLVPSLEYLNERLSEQGYVTPGSSPIEETANIELNEETINGTKRYTLTANVLNTLKDALPSTGGIGTVVFTVLGIGVMATAIVLFFINRKRNR